MFPVGRVDREVEVTTVRRAEHQTETGKEDVDLDKEVDDDHAVEMEVATVRALAADDAEGQGIEMAPDIHNEDESTAKRESKVAADPENGVVYMP